MIHSRGLLTRRNRSDPCKGFNQHVATAVGAHTAHHVVALEVVKQPYVLCLKCGASGLTRLVKPRL